MAGFLACLIQTQAQLIAAGQQGFPLAAVGLHGVQRFCQHTPGLFHLFLFLGVLLIGFFQLAAQTLTAHGDLLQAHLAGADLGIDLTQLPVDAAGLALHVFALFFQFADLFPGAVQLFFKVVHGGLKGLNLALQLLQLPTALENTGFLIFLFGHFQPVRAETNTVTGDHGFVGVKLAAQGQSGIQVIRHIDAGQQTFRHLALNMISEQFALAT